MRNQCLEFINKIVQNKHAEVAPPLKENEECWYLPIFGVFHPQKPENIRVVFDSSAKYSGLSLNDVLLKGDNSHRSLDPLQERGSCCGRRYTADVPLLPCSQRP